MRWALVALAGCAAPAAGHHIPEWVGDTSSMSGSAAPQSIGEHYGPIAQKIITAARADRGAYTKLEQLTDRVGHRLSGSPELDRAIEWAARTMKEDGHDVHTEKVMVPRWVRGVEDAEILGPIERRLNVIGLGGTIATPHGGITAPIVVVHDWAELDMKQAQVKGAIVLYDVAMPPWSEEHGSGYGETVQYRGKGASRAAKYGAVGVLMRSVTAHSLRTPHTGAMNYDESLPKIPALAVTVEDATLLARLATHGQVTVRMRVDDQQLPDVESANVIGELRGSEQPEEIVVIGAHIDSWDVGQGAHDDGAGVVTMMQALTTLRRLGLTPRRTIRVVLFTNEENGLRGGKTYAQDHAAELPKTVLAVESDSGGFAPRGFSIGAKPEVVPRVRSRLAEIVELLQPIGATHIKEGEGGADIGPMAPAGVPTAGLEVDGRLYFDYHHTDADTLDKVDPAALAEDVAAVAVLAYVVADLPARLDAP